MSDILVRGLNSQTVKRLKARAKRNGRSLQGEVKVVLEQSAGADADVAEIVRTVSRWQKRFSGRKLVPSVDLIREDRER